MKRYFSHRLRKLSSNSLISYKSLLTLLTAFLLLSFLAPTSITSVNKFYYNGGGTGVADLNAWGNNPDGTGSHPSNFTTDSSVFVFSGNNGTNSVTAPSTWSIKGVGSKIYVAGGVNLTITSDGLAFATTIDVGASGILTLQGTGNVNLGDLNANSTVVFDGNSTLTIPPSSYGNIASTNDASGTRILSFGSTINIGGSFSPGNATYFDSSTILFNGTVVQHIPMHNYYNLNIGNLAGCYVDNGYVVNTNNNLSIIPVYIVAPYDLVYYPSAVSIAQGTAGQSVVPNILNGGATLNYTISGNPTLPSGVKIDSTTGVISWNASVTSGTYNLIVTATNIAGSVSVPFTLSVVASVVAPSGLSYTPSVTSVYHAVAGNSVVPVINNGGAAVTYSMTGAPIGVTINATTGVISWLNSVNIGAYTLTVTATNSAGSTNTTYTLSVKLNPDDFLVPHFSAVTKVSTTYSSTGSYHQVDVYTPTGDANTQRPAVMFLHGGGFQTSGTNTESYVVSFCTYLAKCGYVAFAPNYNEGGGHTLAQNLLAVKDADLCMNWIRNTTTATTYGYNPNYLFCGGGSAGAHLVCNFCFWDGSANYNGYVVNLQKIIAFADCWGSSPDADRLYNYASLNANSLPVFIVQGSADQTVPVSTSITLNNYLNTAGAYHDFWEITGETHGCPNHIAAISDTMAHFFNRAWKRLP